METKKKTWTDRDGNEQRNISTEMGMWHIVIATNKIPENFIMGITPCSPTIKHPCMTCRVDEKLNVYDTVYYRPRREEGEDSLKKIEEFFRISLKEIITFLIKNI